MPIAALYEDSASISTTEYSLPFDSTSTGAKTDVGVFQCFLDVNALAAGDLFAFKILEKVQAGGTQRMIYRAYLSNAQAEPIFVAPSLVLMHGWDMTLQRLGGSDRTIGWSIRQVA